MRRLISGGLFVMALFGACTGNSTQPLAGSEDSDSTVSVVRGDTLPTDTMEMLIAETPMPETADELFDDFFFNYAANPAVQVARTKFPLLSTDGAVTDTIGRDDWQTEHFFMRQGYYTLLLDDAAQVEQVKNTNVSHVAIEKIYLNDRRVKQYLFDRNNGLWMMMSIKTMPLSDNANADFLMFYEHFVTDSLFQAHSLSPIVEFVGPDPDNDDEQMEGIITDDTWPAFAPELPSKVIYNIVYGKPADDADRKVFLLRGIANGLELQMTFRRKDGRWRLTKLML